MTPTLHPQPQAASAWVLRFVPLIAPGGRVLDYACGGGRHARWLARHGFVVEGVDRDAGALAGLQGEEGITTRLADLEDGPWPFTGRVFDAIIVTNYLFRPRLGDLLDCVAPDGVLIYETFMTGHEAFGRPSNPEFLLRPGELLQQLGDGFTVVAFEQGVVAEPRPAVVQRVCAVKTSGAVVSLPPG